MVMGVARQAGRQAAASHSTRLEHDIKQKLMSHSHQTIYLHLFTTDVALPLAGPMLSIHPFMRSRRELFSLFLFVDLFGKLNKRTNEIRSRLGAVAYNAEANVKK